MHIHLIGIGGSVMHQLAIALHEEGLRISGSDDDLFEPALSALQTHNLCPERLGFRADNIPPQTDCVILGMHARADNPELQAAITRQLPIHSFAAYLSERARNCTRVVVAGSHGKTTTTAMIATILHRVNKRFHLLVGARVPGLRRSVILDEQANIFLFEGDEYLASALEPQPKFLFYRPHIAVLTGIAWDHVNVFARWEDYVKQFALFLQTVQDGGSVFYFARDPQIQALIATHRRDRVEYIPYDTIPHTTLPNGQTRVHGQHTTIDLPLFGEYNMQNLSAAQHVCTQLGITDEQSLQAIKGFQGAHKRMELLTQRPGFRVYIDFAHSPSKVRAAIRAICTQFATVKHKIAVIELHTYSSLQKDFLAHYAHCSEGLDQCLVYYSAHALARKGTTSLDEQSVRSQFGGHNVRVLSRTEDLKRQLSLLPREDAVIALMSSGHFDGLDMRAIFA